MVDITAERCAGKFGAAYPGLGAGCPVALAAGGAETQIHGLRWRGKQAIGALAGAVGDHRDRRRHAIGEYRPMHLQKCPELAGIRQRQISVHDQDMTPSALPHLGRCLAQRGIQRIIACRARREDADVKTFRQPRNLRIFRHQQDMRGLERYRQQGRQHILGHRRDEGAPGIGIERLGKAFLALVDALQRYDRPAVGEPHVAIRYNRSIASVASRRLSSIVPMIVSVTRTSMPRARMAAASAASAVSITKPFTSPR